VNTTTLRRTAAALALGLLVPSLAVAQAWTPPKGEGFLTLTLQSIDADKHLSFEGRPADLGRTQGRAMVIDGDFGITDKLAVTASFSHVGGRFTADGQDDPHGEQEDHGPGDDGRWNEDWQDARASLRFMQPAGAWVLTPSLAVVLPLSDYLVVGHANVGRGLEELQLELDAGRLIDLSGRTRAYAQGGFRYTFTEKVNDLRADRSNVFLELGYLASRKLTLRAFGDWQDSHGGYELPRDLNDQTRHFHDRLAAARWIRLGVGASVPVSRRASVFASVGHTFEGENTHDGTAISIGTSWGFQAPGYGRTKIRLPGSDDGR
jgi:hypothetical protein